MAASTHGSTPYYYVPHPSRHPAAAALGLFFVILGAGQWVNGHGLGRLLADGRPGDLALRALPVVR
jgi:cytochrome c oxidase subunit 3